MAYDNMVTVIGNTTREPEIKFTANGVAYATFGIAWNRKYQRNGEDVEEVSFFDVICWQSLAENVGESIGKGTRVVVVGRLDFQSWDDQESGQKRNKVKIVADEVSPSLRWSSVEVTRNEKDAKPSRSSGGSKGGRSGPRSEDEPF